MSTSQLLADFLTHDLHDALKGLFVGAVTWQAHPEKSDRRYLRGIGMFSSFVQARALYEFFYRRKSSPKLGETASARDFVASWQANDAKGLHSKYMGDRTPAQKRVFHLVYGRSVFSGGTAPDESDHLKNQVLELAQDLLRLTREFVAVLSEPSRSLAESALRKALKEADQLAKEYRIQNPLQ